LEENIKQFTPKVTKQKTIKKKTNFVFCPFSAQFNTLYD